MSKPDIVSETHLLPHGSTRIQVAGPRTGPRVLLVHGMTYPIEVWEPLSKDLSAKGYHVASFDLYGRGEASWDGTPLSPAALAEQARAVLDALDWQGAVSWISLSNSDLVLTWAINQAPARCSSLHFIAPSGFDRRLMNPRIGLASRLPGSSTWLGRRVLQNCVDRIQRHRSTLSPAMERRVGDIYERSVRLAEDNEYFSSAVMSQIRHLPSDKEVHTQLEQLSQHSIPMFSLSFGEEQDSSDSGVVPFFDALPNIQKKMLSKGSHMGLLEHSTEVGSWVLESLRSAAK